MIARAAGSVVAAALALCVVGCTSGSGAASSGAAPPGAASAGAASSGAGPSGHLYVSIGDSYAAGYQPGENGPGRTTRNGFAYQVVRFAAAKGYRFRLVNFGCSGATTASVLTSPGCDARMLGPGAPSYAVPQVAAAEAFVRAHRAGIALITVSLGGNDITACATAADPATCLSAAVTTVQQNLGTLLRRLRAAAGPTVRIVGTTYPDVFLGMWVSSDPDGKNLARTSVLGFRMLFNPALQATYGSVGASFVDVTAATGAYIPLDEMTLLAPYGQIPVAAARACELTYFCDRHDIHPTAAGYAVIAQLIVGTLSRR